MPKEVAEFPPKPISVCSIPTPDKEGWVESSRCIEEELTCPECGSAMAFAISRKTHTNTQEVRLHCTYCDVYDVNIQSLYRVLKG